MNRQEDLHPFHKPWEYPEPKPPLAPPRKMGGNGAHVVASAAIGYELDISDDEAGADDSDTCVGS